MEISGKLKETFEEQSFSSGFRKREFVITTQEQYPQDLKFELVNDRCADLNNYKKGDELNVQFDIRGNEYQGKYYVNLRAWRLDAGKGAGASAVPNMANAPLPSTPPPTIDSMPTDDDDLPF